MSPAKQASLLFRLALTFIAMFVAYTLSTMVIGEGNLTMTPEQASQAARGLGFVALIDALVLAFLIVRSRWYGLRLVGVVTLVQFSVETFMAQIETLYFNSALQMGTAEFVGIVGAGALRAVIFAPLAVLILGKMTRPAAPEEQGTATLPRAWGGRLVALSVLYVFVYFMFGYFVAWQWEATRLFYSGTTAIKPFFTHFWDLFVKEDPMIIPFQLLRGVLWTWLALTIVRMIKGKRWQAALAVALTFAVFLALPVGLFPNPYMPPLVRQAHFFELVSSMLLFGGIAGWGMYREG